MSSLTRRPPYSLNPRTLRSGRFRSRTLRAGLFTGVLVAGLTVGTAGTAVAGHVTAVELSPDSDVAAVGTCNAFTVQLTPGQSTVVDVLLSQTAPAGGSATVIGFCDPSPTPGPNVQPAPNTGTVSGGVPTATPNTCQGTTPTAATTGPNTCNAEYTTNGFGQLTFGVLTNQPGTMAVTAYVEEPNQTPIGPNTTGNGNPDGVEPRDSSLKTWVAGGVAAVNHIECVPETDANPEGTTHTFGCTAFTSNPQTGALDVPVTGVRIWFDVISGPNSDERGPTQCATNTDNNGQTSCSYTDNTSNTVAAVLSPPGTDTIIAYVSNNPSAGPAANDPADTIFKTWIGPARNIVCQPRTADNPSGSVHTVTCTVTDVNNQPVNGQSVRFTELGVGSFANSQSTAFATTNAAGVATAQTSTTAFENGTESITAELVFANPVLAGPNNNCVAPTYTNCNNAAAQQTATGRAQECQQPAGTTTATGNPNTATTTAPGSGGGNCSDMVAKNWVAGGPSTSPPASSPPASSPPASSPPASSPPASSSPPPTTITPCSNATPPDIFVNPSTIAAGQSSTVTVTGTPGTTIEVLARTSGQQYATVRQATVPQGGAVDFLVSPRYTIRVAARSCGLLSRSQPIISVRARISMGVGAFPACVVRFSGSTLPVKPGQLVNVYYRNASGGITLAVQTRTASNGAYSVQRAFAACGRTITFFSRVNADVNNLAAQSPDRRVTIRR
ncbi:MAG: hypothetical protein LC640_04960 [Frankia sp.]|nr:hypothetical protein [Frankia sp.]